jgi:hypothetical protein
MIKNIEIIEEKIPNFAFTDVRYLTDFNLQMYVEFGEKKSIFRY